MDIQFCKCFNIRLVCSVMISMDNCWFFAGKLSPQGYGQLRFYENGKHHYWAAHRVMYENLVGPIPEGLVIDHLCRNPICINPEHLEPVTPRENVLRGSSPLAGFAKQTHCKRGHEFTKDNTTIIGKSSRRCKKCYVTYYTARNKYKAEIEKKYYEILHQL